MKPKICHIVLNVLLALLFTSCAAVQPAIGPGDVLSVQQGQVVFGIQQALAGKPGTTLLVDPTGKFFLASWPCSGAQAWAFITENIETWMGSYSGNLGSLRTWDELKGALDKLAWVPVSGATFLKALSARGLAVISRITITVSEGASAAALSSMVPIPIFVIPALLDPDNLIRPKVSA